MSGRSFPRELIVGLAGIAIAAGLAGCKTTRKPEADPAKVTALAKAMVVNAPAPAALKACTPADLLGASLTQLTVLRLAKEAVSDAPERADWINPSELDHPAARILLDAATSDEARRQAAAELLAAPSYVVYRVDMVNVPMALGIKELKRGALGMRAIGYNRAGDSTCVTVFTVQNDKAKSEWAMDKSDRAVIDPAIAKALRDDLKDQLLKRVASMTATAPATAPAP